MEMHSRMAQEPLSGGFILVDIEVVQDNMEFTEGVGLYHLIHETQEVHRRPAVPDMGDDFAGGDFQSGQQRLRAMPDIFVGPADATFRMPPDFGAAEGRDEMFRLWIEGGFGSERFGRVRCVVTHANLQPAVACYQCRPGDSTWRALALEVLRIEDGLITEIVVFPPDSFPAFRLPMMMDAPPEMNKCH